MTLRGKIFILSFFIAVCTLVPLMRYTLQLRGESVRPADLYRVVYGQLSAFRASDYPRAYSQASYSIQQKFKPDQFIDMIRHSYGDIMHADHIEFGIVRCREQHALIQVFFIQRDGGVVPCIYSLVYEGEMWKIDGARLLQRWPTGSHLGGIRA